LTGLDLVLNVVVAVVAVVIVLAIAGVLIDRSAARSERPGDR
jgi:hypothetical protein